MTDLDEAIQRHKAQLERNPGNYPVALKLGIALFQAGKIEEAIAAFTQAASMGTDEIGAHLNLAKLLRAQGDALKAQEWLLRAYNMSPSSAEARYDIGQAFFDGRAFGEAARAFTGALAVDPKHRMAGLQLIAANLSLGNLAGAKEQVGRMVEQFPGDMLVAQARLLVARGLQDAAEGLAAARDILLQSPDNAEALREVVGHSSDATEKSEGFEKLLICCRRGHAGAEDWKALAAAQPESYANQIEILEEGIEATGDPLLRLYRAQILPKVPMSNAEIDASRAAMERHLDILTSQPAIRGAKLEKFVNRVPYRLAYHGRNDRPLMEKLAKAHLAVAPDLAWVSPHLARPRNVRNKIRIGFLSAFFERHSVGKMVRKLIEDIDRSKFEIFILRPNPAKDDFGAAIDAASDAVIVYPHQTAAARSAIAAADLDILFYADIGMEPLSYYLAYARLARTQVVWPGHPVTTGLTSIDAYISGATAEPTDAQSHYTERLVQFSDIPIYEEARPTRAEPDFKQKFRTPDGPLYVCAMTEQKFHPDFDNLLRRIFAADPRANFAMVGSGGVNTQLLQKRLISAVPELDQRLVILPWLNQREFTALLKTADALLDTPHFSGSGTSRDASTLGSIMVSIESAFMRGRLTTGMYRDMGLPHLVNSTPQAYVEMAVNLANDPSARARLGAEAQAAMPSLVLRKQVLKEFEELFENLLVRL